jgi:hypothetical protein
VTSTVVGRCRANWVQQAEFADQADILQVVDTIALYESVWLPHLRQFGEGPDGRPIDLARVMCRYVSPVGRADHPSGTERSPGSRALGEAAGDPPLLCSSYISLAVLVVCFLLDALLTRHQSALRLQAEVLALRHQLCVPERQFVARVAKPT